MDAKAVIAQNPWWGSGRVPDAWLRPYKRHTFEKLAGLLNGRRAVNIIGPRRVGKTTLMYQLINWLLEKGGVNPRRILYLSADSPALGEWNLQKLFDFYEVEVLKSEISKTPVYCFIDEVQFLPDWERWIKHYFDSGLPVHFVLSGSAATLIKRGIRESLAGRAVEEPLEPFSFGEFLECAHGIRFDPELALPLNGGIKKLDKVAATVNEKKIRLALDEFMHRGGFPEYFSESEFSVWSRLLRSDVVEKALYRDMAQLYGVKLPSLLESLLLYLARNDGSIFNYTNAANILGLNRLTVLRYVGYLKAAYLVNEARNYGPSAAKSLRSATKIYLTDTGLSNGLSDESHLSGERRGRMAESAVFNHLRKFGQTFYWRDASGHEVDFILKRGQDIIPVEVKYQDEIRAEDLRGVTRFCARFRTGKPVIVTKNTLEERKDASLVPLWLFLLVNYHR